MKTKSKINTRQAIIDAAGELFAVRGLDGTGIRAIVNKAGTALCSVNYHFRNKEDLYEECINFVLREKLNLSITSQALDNCSSNNPQDVSNALFQMISESFQLVFNPDNPNWYGVLLIRAKHEKHPLSEKILEAMTAPRRTKDFLLNKVPGISNEEAYLWVFSLTGQLQNFVISKNTVLEAFNLDDYSPQFIATLVNYSAKNLIRSLNLPEPESLKGVFICI